MVMRETNFILEPSHRSPVLDGSVNIEGSAMRTMLLASGLALGLVPLGMAAPTFAQAQAIGQGSESSSQQASTPSPQEVVDTLQRNLEQQGYRNIKVVHETFMVTATDKDGQPTVMLVSPGSVTGVVMGKNGPVVQTAQASPSSGQATLNGTGAAAGAQSSRAGATVTNGTNSGTSSSGAQQRTP
jgi:hypothetical protein